MKDFFELREKAVSQQQQKLMGLALAYKRGEISADEISPQAKAMADKMSEKDLEDFAKTKHKGLPVKKEEVELVSEGIKDDAQKVIDQVVAVANKKIGRDRWDQFNAPIEFAKGGKSWTRGDGARYKDSAQIAINRYGGADEYKKATGESPIDTVWNIIKKTGKHVGDIKGEHGSDSYKEAYKIGKTLFVNHGYSIGVTTPSALRNKDVWRMKEEVEQVDEYRSSSIDRARNRVNRAKTGQQTVGDRVHNALHKVKSKFTSKKPVKQTGLYHAIKKNEEVGPDEATIKLDTKKLKVGDKVKTSKGTVEIVHRPTKRRGEDEFKMILHAKDGKKYDMGSHPGPSASAVQSIVSNSKLTRPMTEATKVPAGMKFAGGHVYKGGDGKDHRHTYYSKGGKMTDPVVVYIDGKEWKTFDRLTKAKKAALDYIKGMKPPSKFRKEEQDPLLADENPVTENGQDFFELREKLSEQVLAHGGKGQYKAVKKGGVVHIMYKGKKVGTADYDSGADAYFASIKGVRGQKDFETAQDMVDYFAKNKITEARYYRGDRVKTMYKPPAPKMGDKSSSGYDLYHKSYSAAMQHAYAHAKKQGYEVDMDDVHDKVAMGPKKPSEGKTNSFLLKLKNEPKKRLSVQVYGMGGGKYELNTYITR